MVLLLFWWGGPLIPESIVIAAEQSPVLLRGRPAVDPLLDVVALALISRDVAEGMGALAVSEF